MEELYWPAESPDLNPIQLLWDELEADTELGCISQPHIVAKMVQISGFKNGVEGFPRRLEAVKATE